MRYSKHISVSALFVAFILFLSPYFTYGIYPDEVALQIWSTRFWEDAPYRGSLFGMCGEMFAVKIPYPLYIPAIVLSPISWISDIRVFRALTTLLLSITLYLIYRIFLKEVKNPKAVFILYTFLVLAGTKLFSVVIFRPESIVFLVLILGYYILCLNKKLISKIIFTLLYACSLYMHPFGIYFFPAILIVIRNNFFLILFCIISSYCSIGLWNDQLFKCENLAISDLMNSFNINLLDLYRNPINFLDQIKGNMSYSRLEIIINSLTINDNYSRQGLANYLPKFNSSNIVFVISNIITIAVFIASILYSLIFIIKNIIFYKKINYKISYILFVFIGLLTHLVLNKTNAFYAVNFWYLILSFFLMLGVSELLNRVFLKSALISLAVIFGVCVNLMILSDTLKYGGPNINLINSYYSNDYRAKIQIKFKECCGDLQDAIYMLDDASYFALKKLVKTPVPITYSLLFGAENEAIRAQNIRYSIVQCGTQKYINGEGQGDKVDGGLGDLDVCFKKIKFND